MAGIIKRLNYLRRLRFLKVFLGIFERNHVVWSPKVMPTPSMKSRIAQLMPKIST